MRNVTFTQKISLVSLILIFFAFGATRAQNGGNDEVEDSVLRTIDDPALQWGPCPPFMPDGCNIAVLHGDPSKERADVLFRVNGNSFIPNHWHSSAERMVLLSGKLEVTYEGEETGTLKLGHCAFGPAKKPHAAKCVSQDPCVLYIGFNEPVDAFAVEE